MPSKLPSALIGGLATAVLVIGISVANGGASFNVGGTPSPAQMILGCLGCLVYLISGLVAVWHYTGQHSVTLTGSEGVLLGLFSGVLAGIIAAVLSYILVVIGLMPNPEEMMEEMRRTGMFDQPGGGTTEGIMELFSGPSGLVFGAVIGAIQGGILGLAGGAIGRAIWKKGESSESEAKL